MSAKRYDPPANMPDFNDIPGQLQQWSDAVSGWTNEAIKHETDLFDAHPRTKGQKCQYYNLLAPNPPAAPVLGQDIIWNGFPRTLQLHYGQQRAYEIAEQLFSLADPTRPGLPTSGAFFFGDIWKNLYYRPHDEYCEWRAERNPATGQIIRITFTSEPPEYWQAMHGDTLPNLAANPQFHYQFTGSHDKVLELYRQYVSPDVQYDDLICHEDFVSDDPESGPSVIYQKGGYNPYNKWNTTHGIMHLCQPNNTISAEIQLGADATVLREKSGRLVTVADALVCCAGYGGTARSSDPTIGASINALARLGASVTIANPLGLYMHDINTQGWTKPNGEPIAPDEYFRVLRGDREKGMIERAVFEVPEKEGFTVSDIRIGGVPIRYGGQVTEHINIKIGGQAAGIGQIKNKPFPCTAKCCIEQDNPTNLTRVIAINQKCPDGYISAFNNLEGTFDCGRPLTAAAAEVALPVAALPRKRKPIHHR